MINAGELVVPNTPAPVRPLAEHAPVAPLGPVAVSTPPAATGPELDRAIAARRAAVEAERTAIADLDRRLAAPARSRLKTLLSGESADDRPALIARRQATEERIAGLAAEIVELERAREPLLADQRVHEYDVAVRPKLRTAVVALAAHLRAAQATLVDAEGALSAGERLAGMALARGVNHQRTTGDELAEPDAREISLLRGWAATLTGRFPNPSRLERWLDEVRHAGIALDGKVRR